MTTKPLATLLAALLVLSACSKEDEVLSEPEPDVVEEMTITPTTTLPPTTTTIDYETLEQFLGYLDGFQPKSVVASRPKPPTPPPVVVTTPPPPGPAGTPSPAQWVVLRLCESSHNYAAVSRTGKYRGAYQFDQATWNSVVPAHFVGVDPATASPADQDAAALALWQSRGWQPWPQCGLKAAAAA